MVQWLRRASQGYEMLCHDLQLMSSDFGWVEFAVAYPAVRTRRSAYTLKYRLIIFGPSPPDMHPT